MANISECVVSGFSYLTVLLENLNNKALRDLLVSNKKTIKSLTEIAHNLLLGNFSLSLAEKHSLKKYKKELVLLAKKQNSREKKLLLLSKNRSFLSTVLNIALPKLAKTLWHNQQ